MNLTTCDISIIELSEYLSTVDKRMEWQQNKLPVDELCIENAIMLERYNRYPLIVDPSGQATDFIMKQYADKVIIIIYCC